MTEQQLDGGTASRLKRKAVEQQGSGKTKQTKDKAVETAKALNEQQGCQKVKALKKNRLDRKGVK